MTHRLELWGKHTLISKQMTNEQMAAENARLKAENERLEHAIVAGKAIVPDAREVQP